MLVQLIPDGPLHPDDALAAFVAGVAVALITRWSSVAWIAGVVAAAGFVFEVRHGSVISGALDARPNVALDVALILAAVAVLAVRPVPPIHAGLVALGAAAGVWAVVPDTEAPLVAGAVLAGALLVGSLARGALVPTRLGGVLVVLPLIAALVGSVGRPERHGPALAVAALGSALAASGLALLRRIRRQRAGTPTTVAPGATSSTTTAPAPTTAP